MQQYLYVLKLTLIPFAGNFLGGLISEKMKVTKFRLSTALHLSAGILLGVVATEIMPQVLEARPFWSILLGFFLGAVFSIGIGKLQKKFMAGKEESSSMGIFIAVCTDNFSDGLLVGTGTAISPDLGAILAMGQALANMPGGYAAIASMKDSNVPFWKRLLANSFLIVPGIVGATVGFWILKDLPEYVKLSFLVFTAAILLKAAVEEMVGSAHEEYKNKNTTQVGAFLFGFLLFTFSSVYLE